MYVQITLLKKNWESGVRPFLTCRVPDLQLDLLPLDVDHPGSELDADGQVVHGLEALVSELQQKAGLAHA